MLAPSRALSPRLVGKGNWANADDYLKAAEMYNAGYCEDRKVVKDGHLTGDMKHVCVNAVVTWTPGDVNIAKGKGGLEPIVTSKQYRSQMPATIIGPKMFFQKNRSRWKHWSPQSPETAHRLQQAESEIAECEKHLD